MTEMIDIGVNLTNPRLMKRVDTVISEAAAEGVSTLIVTGTSVEESRQATELCQQYPDALYATCGVHPHDARHWQSDTLEQLKTIASHPSVKAIGETGLDFNRDFSPRPQQLSAFEQQLELAVQIKKPLFLHQRDAFDAFCSLLKEYRDRVPDAVAHCFTDNKKALYALLDLDCHIGITGWICDERRGLELRSLVRDIPPDRLMLETDAPYLLPRDLPEKPEGKLNLPKYLPHILQRVAQHQQKPVEQLAGEVLDTTRQFFGLDA